MSNGVRRLVAAVVPEPVKRRHERWATSRHRQLIAAPTDAYVRDHGLVVRRGPFAGTQLLAVDAWGADLVAKLAGTYEQELHGAIGEWLAEAPSHVVDVGCAEGYYAVGLARALPAATVHAFDVDPQAREQTAVLARHNGVAERVRVRSACRPETLAELPDESVAMLVDCEGCEAELLDPVAQPRLRRWSIVVELHEFLDPDIAAVLAERFAASHEVELVEQADRDGDIPELAHLDAATREALLGERRPARMRWAVMRPR